MFSDNAFYLNRYTPYYFRIKITAPVKVRYNIKQLNCYLFLSRACPLLATITVLAGTSSKTKLIAPIFALSPIVTFPIIVAPAPIKTLSLITGVPL